MRVLLLSATNEAGVVTPLPLGLACVAASTDMAGQTATLLTLQTGADWESDVRQQVQAFAPDVIGVSVRNIDDQNMQAPCFLLESLKPVIAACRACAAVARPV